ncbi:MAG: MFS transporter [Caldilineae bacterium]|nr:MAG: MFS transporter [Caldilineae bacterium]
MSKETSNNRSVLTVLFIGVLMGALDIAIVGPALPAIRTHFQIDDRASVWIFTIYVLFNLIGAPFMSKLSDRYGRRSIYLLDISIFALGSLIVALSPTFAVLLLGRVLQGLSAGGIFPVASAVIGDTFPEERRGSALGLIGAVFGLAFLVGPILGGVLLMWGWQWLFLINLPVAVLLLVMGSRVLPTSRPATPQPFDWFGMASLAIFLAGLTFGINQLDTNNLVASLGSTQVWPYLALSLVGLLIFLWAEGRAADPIIRLSLFSSRQMVIANVLSAGAGLGEAAMVFVPALAVAAFSVSESQASFLLLPIVLAVAVGSPIGGRLLDAVGAKPVVLGGTSLLALGMLFLGFWGANFPAFIVAGVLIGLGLASLLGAPIRYIVLGEAPVEERAAAQGLITIATGVGQLVSGALVGAVAASQGGGVEGYTFSYLCVGGAAVLLILVSLGLKSREQAAQSPATEAARP